MDEIEPHGVNVPLLRKTLERVTAHPEEWNQHSWASTHSCGTTMCLAGTAVYEAGYDIDWVNGAESIGLLRVVAEKTTTGHDIDTLAAELLGLDEDATEDLFFYMGDNVRVLWDTASRITNGEIEVPADLPGGAA